MKKLYLAGIAFLVLSLLSVSSLSVSGSGCRGCSPGGCYNYYFPPEPTEPCADRCESWNLNGWGSYSECFDTCKDREQAFLDAPYCVEMYA